jgi:hypothetical protein
MGIRPVNQGDIHRITLLVNRNHLGITIVELVACVDEHDHWQFVLFGNLDNKMPDRAGVCIY